MKWEFSNNKPIFQQVVDILQGQIVKGEYKPGERIDSVRKLAVEAGVNPNTMQRSLAELEKNGLIFTKRGFGRFVSEDKEKYAEATREILLNRTREYVADMRSWGKNDEEIDELISYVKGEGK